MYRKRPVLHPHLFLTIGLKVNLLLYLSFGIVLGSLSAPPPYNKEQQDVRKESTNDNKSTIKI